MFYKIKPTKSEIKSFNKTKTLNREWLSFLVEAAKYSREELIERRGSIVPAREDLNEDYIDMMWLAY
jgi:hypothetical protein